MFFTQDINFDDLSLLKINLILRLYKTNGEYLKLILNSEIRKY